MNYKISLPFLLLITAPLLCANRKPVPTENENNPSTSFIHLLPVAQEKYIIDKKESVVKWKCSMALADKGSHYGYVTVSKGEFLTEKDQIMGGTVEVDMSTISDELHNSNNNLIEHLQSPDFFDVKKFPTSAFIVTKIASANRESVTITGNLTIKEITHEVTFPATVEVRRGVLTASGKMTIDRTQWDVRYRSGKFFDDLADAAISDDIEFDMKIVARK